jgi:hypothetical protein
LTKGAPLLLPQRKQAKLPWLQDPSEIKVDDLNSIRCETSRNFRINKRVYMNDKINELPMSSKNNNIRDPYRGTNKFKRV